MTFLRHTVPRGSGRGTEPESSARRLGIDRPLRNGLGSGSAWPDPSGFRARRA